MGTLCVQLVEVQISIFPESNFSTALKAFLLFDPEISLLGNGA